MSRPILSKVPLQEAIFEFRWGLHPHEISSDLLFDSNYKLLVGRFFDRIRVKYPHHEALAMASMPDEMVAYNVQHRFREVKDGWPLVQLGPGVLTVNHTQKYEWPDFLDRCNTAMAILVDSYPDIEKLKPQQLTLRFINNLETGDSGYQDFLKDKMRVAISLPEALFSSGQVASTPKYVNLLSEFPSAEPKGVVAVRFESAVRKSTGQRLIRMETTVLSLQADVPSIPDGIKVWTESAHKIIEDWFFTIIDGEILNSLK